MKNVIGVIILAAVLWAGWSFWNYAQRTISKSQVQSSDQPQYAPGKLPGLPISLEPSLDAAEKQGPSALRDWLSQHRQEVEDPRLTDIELDYVVLVGPNNPAEARHVLDAIKDRISTNSPAYKRFHKLDEAYH